MSQTAQKTPPTHSSNLTSGLDSLEQEMRVDSLPLEGQLPAWLQGSLVRTGPAKWEVGGRSMNHWFDGFAMLHRFGIADGEVSYANRFLETKAYRAAKEKDEIVYSEFATDPCRSLFARVFSMFSPKISDNANVNLVKLGERYISMTETPIPVEFDGDTLETVGRRLQVAGDADHRPSTPRSRSPAACSIIRPSSARGIGTGSSTCPRAPRSRRCSPSCPSRSPPTCTPSASPSAGWCWRSSRWWSTRSASRSRAGPTSRTIAGSRSAARSSP